MWEWARRWREASTAERASLTCLAERSSRPRRLADEPGIVRTHSTVHRVLQRAGVSRRPTPERPVVVRYLWPCPGQLLHMDTKKLGRFEQPGTS